MNDKDDSLTSFETSSEFQTESNESIRPKRGRPKKSIQTPQSQYNAIYNTTLGYQYMIPRAFPITVGYNNALYKPPMYRPCWPTGNPINANQMYNQMHPVQSNLFSSSNICPTQFNTIQTKNQIKKDKKIEPLIRRKRKAAQDQEQELEIINEMESEETEMDRIEKILEMKNEKYFVKFRGKSYLHCNWVEKDEIIQTRAGAIKLKRFRPKEDGIHFNPEYVKVDKILAIDNDNYLVKWKMLGYEYCTWENEEDLKFGNKNPLKLVMSANVEDKGILDDKVNNQDESIIMESDQCPIPADLPRDDSIIASDSIIPDDTIIPINQINIPTDLEIKKSFDEALHDYKRMRTTRISKWPIEWRPVRTTNITPEFKNPNLNLRTYQLEGLNWLINRWAYRQSCIMADEMGLGKTVQSVTFVNSLFTIYGYCSPVIVVSPLSTLIHWEREFKTWTDLRVLTFHSSLSGRDLIYDYEFGKPNNLYFDVLLLTYETVMSSVKFLSDINFGIGILDEAHKLKNANSKAATVLRSLRINHKVLLTGTPLQNNLNELWSLLNFINPGNFPSLQNFLEEYKLEKEEDVDRLQLLLKPLMLRRMKEDVEKSIPLKEETIIEVELTMIQKKYYKAILEKNLEFLKKGGSESAPNLLNAMMELRKCCIHPYLIKGAEETILSEEIKKRNEKSGARDNKNILSVNALSINDQFNILIASSGKLVLLDKLLNKLHGNHKVLVFSQMTRCLDILSDYLTYRKFKFERLDGGVRGEQRQASIDRFTNTDSFVFLLCTRAGGVGINLTAADTVVIFDSDWNPQNDLQAQARCHRIGQTNEVKIYRLITRNTYEREMFDKAGLKLGLDKAILTSSVQVKKKKDAVEILLKKGAYGVLMENDEACMKFCEEDIDQILERRTKIIRHEEGGNVFSKATFQVEEEYDDPDFWENLLSKKTKEEKEGRIKRQVRRVAREADLTEEEINEIDQLILSTTSKLEEMNILEIDNENPLENEIKLKCLLTFLISLRKGFKSLATLKFSYKIYFSAILDYCLNQIHNKKLKDDMVFLLDRISEPTKIKIIENEKIYEKYGNKMLLRIQLPLILQSLIKKEDYNIEKVRGWSKEDDKRLVKHVLSFGYDNFPSSVGSEKGFIRGKTADELNQRIRKIITSYKNEEEINDTPEIFNAVLMFGKITNKNKNKIEDLLKDKIKIMEELIEKVLIKRGRRRPEEEIILFDRINLIEKFIEIKDMPIIKKKMVGLPRKWKVEDDIKLQEIIKKSGLCEEELKEINLKEEVAIKRMEQIVRGSFGDEKSE